MDMRMSGSTRRRKWIALDRLDRLRQPGRAVETAAVSRPPRRPEPTTAIDEKLIVCYVRPSSTVKERGIL